MMTSLRADWVPHRRWAVTQWFFANPIWYYHCPSSTHEIDTGGRFYRLVDPELRDVCKLLHEAGIATTPSCQGHSHPRERFERIWDELKREEPSIRCGGLMVKDSENQKSYLFRDPRYRVPWESFERFHEQAASQQNVGYLGLLIPPAHGELSRRLEEEKYRSVATTIDRDHQLGRVLRHDVFHILVDAIDPQSRSIEWQNLTQYLRAAVERELAGQTR